MLETFWRMPNAPWSRLWHVHRIPEDGSHVAVHGIL